MTEQVVIEGTTATSQTLADGTLRVKIDIPPADAENAYPYFGKPGKPVALAPLTYGPETQRARVIEENNGQAMEVLHRTGWFSELTVCIALGFDNDFLAFVREHDCIMHGSACKGDIVAAHINRVSRGSGKGIKAKFSAVPMCDFHHQLQHQLGYSAVGGIESLTKKAMRYAAKWSTSKMKARFGVESLKQVSPEQLAAFADENEIPLPAEFANYVG